MTRRLLFAIIFLSAFGVLLSTYSYLHSTGAASGEFCSIGETFNCDVVNQGPYSEFLGIKVALLGILGYFIFGLTAFLKMRDPKDKGIGVFLLLATFGGLLFSLYLTGIEAFVLHTYCLLCLTSQALMLFIFAGALKLYLMEHKKPNVKQGGQEHRIETES